MASGKVHLAANRLVLPGVVIATAIGTALAGFDPLITSLGSGLGMFFGQWVEPDLDMVNRTESEIRAIEANCFLHLWVWYWIPYARIFSHRGISHVPILGTVTRLVYLLPFVYVLWHCSGALFNWIILGLILSDILHWLLDKCPLNFRL